MGNHPKQVQESFASKSRGWRSPGAVVFLSALALATLGWVLVIRESRRIPVDQATMGGLRLEMTEARWVLDQMDHGENFQKPSVMMPDMPEWGKQRVTLELSLDNVSDLTQIFDGSEFFLVPQLGEEVAPIGAHIGYAQLAPGQTFHTAIHFDFDTGQPHGNLQVEWRRDDDIAYLPIPAPAEHYHLRPRGGEIALPPDARLVRPLGKPERGARLYAGVYGCAACHGDPSVVESNRVGPHLAGIGSAGADRIEGLAADQYIYESILDPGAFIAPECRGGQPCAEPSAMPEYASLMSLQDVADLLSYLLEQRG